MKLLEQLQHLVNELNTTTSTVTKTEILEKHFIDNKDLQKLVMYVFNPFYQFYLTSDVLKKNKELREDFEYSYDDIFEILNSLKNREVTGHDAIKMVNSFASDFVEYRELIYNIIDKDLKCRIGDKLINKAIPNLIPTFEVALGHAYEDDMDIDFENEQWYVSRKLDGTRLVVVIDSGGRIDCYSRKGKEIETLQKVKDEIKKLNLKNVVFDGEVCLTDDNGLENFQSIISEIRRKDHTIQNPKYFIFDYLTYDEFFSKKSNSTLTERFNELKGIVGIKNSNILTILHQEIVNDKSFIEWQDKVDKNNWEGLILRKDTTYKGKRSKDILKVKKFKDAEYKVLRLENGPFRVVVEGKEVTEEMLTNVYINHKDNEVSVGSGFSIEQRREFYKNPNLLLNKLITVKYFAESRDKQGKYSLRFPVCKHIWNDEKI